MIDYFAAVFILMFVPVHVDIAKNDQEFGCLVMAKDLERNKSRYNKYSISEKYWKPRNREMHMHHMYMRNWYEHEAIRLIKKIDKECKDAD